MNSSEDLISRSRAGDHEAFRLIFQRYARPVLSFIYDLICEREWAEELTQETFVRAYKNLHNIRDDTKLASWLFGIGRNVAREALRIKQKETRRFLLTDYTAEMVKSDFDISPANDLFQKEVQVAVRRALAFLDTDQRSVFVLKVFHQCSYSEIVEITGFTLAKVKTDLHRARVEMRQRMSPFLETQ